MRCQRPILNLFRLLLPCKAMPSQPLQHNYLQHFNHYLSRMHHYDSQLIWLHSKTSTAPMKQLFRPGWNTIGKSTTSKNLKSFIIYSRTKTSNGMTKTWCSNKFSLNWLTILKECQLNRLIGHGNQVFLFNKLIGQGSQVRLLNRLIGHSSQVCLFNKWIGHSNQVCLLNKSCGRSSQMYRLNRLTGHSRLM